MAIGWMEAAVVGDDVLIWSRTTGSWCSGKVVRVENGTAAVQYEVPGGATPKVKVLPLGHEDLKEAPRGSAAEGHAEAAEEVPRERTTEANAEAAEAMLISVDAKSGDGTLESVGTDATRQGPGLAPAAASCGTLVAGPAAATALVKQYCISSFGMAGSCGAPGAPASTPTVVARLTSRAGDYYNIRVVVEQADSVETRQVQRRYREFSELDQQLRSQFPGLPRLPEKSFWRKNFKQSFLELRERDLKGFVVALTEADPSASNPVLQRFLEVPSAPAMVIN